MDLRYPVCRDRYNGRAEETVLDVFEFEERESSLEMEDTQMVGHLYRRSRSLHSNGGFSHESRSFYDGGAHFLQACHLCNKPLGNGRDIFMYRGDTPFCSEECREEQMAKDEAMENRRRSSPSSNNKKQTKTTRDDNFHVRAGTVAAG
ncbi:uncharacterized protein LOC18443777 [Amborella trichopoda]|uniref:FLZ-type domain-containing protein n=1 Tax=Amborella trichopoda TaxID=13333 RepID=U5D550_AMBTC|nr:uncharacterized protein LOC18443777 [Amborella trichopoda]ERN15488.1 hypothetical protein AMTR_s00048p00032230 [Amborella trichopoda]|eukprot:XP_006854021.1 uncharacterized protein LOC18443777 [Amborella trichopoda]